MLVLFICQKLMAIRSSGSYIEWRAGAADAIYRVPTKTNSAGRGRLAPLPEFGEGLGVGWKMTFLKRLMSRPQST